MKIGIIGGGQLGMMMADAAHHLGHEVIGLDPNPNCSLSTNANEMLIGSYDNLDIISKLVEQADVITYEFENVDLQMIDMNVDKIPQKSQALRQSNHRLTEKNFASTLKIPTPEYQQYNNKDNIKPPCIIKTCTGGYDGKGQYLITDIEKIDQLYLDPSIEYIVEEFIAYDYEISVVATRGINGQIVTFPITVNKHKNGILFTSLAGANIPSNIQEQAIKYSTRIIESLDYVGTMAVEYFVRGNDVIFNEFAPRPHNSGHYTIDGCNVSQFENHIRAITGMNLVVPALKTNTMMLNLIGVKPLNKEVKIKNKCFTHDYYKEDCRLGRKMGHVTCLSSTVEDLKIKIAKQVEKYYG